MHKLVCGFHCDAYGHVNNARYLEFFEEARWLALTDNNLVKTIDTLSLQFFVVNINVDFKKPVKPNDTVSIQTSLGEVKRKTMSFVQTITSSGLVTTRAEITFVLFDTMNNRAATITDEMVELFKPLKNA